MSSSRKKPLEQERREYMRGGLREDSLPEDPMDLFELWIGEARLTTNPDPTAMNLSTADASGHPSSRMVLLKAIEDGKLIFFTNYQSRKAEEMQYRSHVAAHFYWPELERQVRVEGTTNRLGDASSDRYFSSRPVESQIGTWASPQSRVIPDRNHLEKEFEKFSHKFKAEKEIPRPRFWGGYAITPVRMEFWQGGIHRLHDRIEYRKGKDIWSRYRLAP